MTNFSTYFNEFYVLGKIGVVVLEDPRGLIYKSLSLSSNLKSLTTTLGKNPRILTNFIMGIIIIIIIKNEKIRVTLCENAAGALYIVNNSMDHRCTERQLRNMLSTVVNRSDLRELNYTSHDEALNKSMFTFTFTFKTVFGRGSARTPDPASGAHDASHTT